MSNLNSFPGSSTGLAVCLAAAAPGLYLLVYHLNHVLLAVPYVFLLACPLMHRGHHGHPHRSGAERDDSAPAQWSSGVREAGSGSMQRHETEDLH